MIAEKLAPSAPVRSMLDLLPESRPWESVAVVVTDQVDRTAYDLALQLARQKGARIVLYDAQASSGWTSPYPPEAGIRPVLLSEPSIRRSGRTALANAVRDLERDGAQASAYLSTTRRCGDLRRLVAAEQIDLVICTTSLEGSRVRNVHIARQEGAHLLLCPPGGRPELHAPLGIDEPVPVETRIQARFLVGLFLTFVAAGLRNRSRS